MCASDRYVSPYLRRRLRSYEEVLRERTEQAHRVQRVDRPMEPTTRDPVREAEDDADSSR